MNAVTLVCAVSFVTVAGANGDADQELCNGSIGFVESDVYS